MNSLDLLKKKSFRSFVYFMTRKDRYPALLKPIMFALQNRILIVHGFIKGYFTSKEALLLALPKRFKSKTLREKFYTYTITEITLDAKEYLRDFINLDGSVTVYGNNFYPAKDNYGELIELLLQVFVLDQYDVAEYLVDNSIIIDAGANIGSFSVFAANLKKNLVIHSFEPVKETYEVLSKNVSPYKNIFCYNMGLGDSDSKKKIFISKEATVGSSFSDGDVVHVLEKQTDGLSEEARITTIDSFVKLNNVPRVDFIKIDTEGYEANILEGARETIKKFEPVISMSAYHKSEDKVILPQIMKSINPNYDYKLVCVDEVDIIFFPKENK